MDSALGVGVLWLQGAVVSQKGHISAPREINVP